MNKNKSNHKVKNAVTQPRKKYSKKNVINQIEKKQGVYISGLEDKVISTTKVTYKCKCGYITTRTASRIYKHPRCVKCKHEKTRILLRKHTKNYLNEKAMTKGGEYKGNIVNLETLETEKVIATFGHQKKQKEFFYIKDGEPQNAKSKVLFSCALGHNWVSTGDRIINQNTWCPECNVGVTEKIVRACLKAIYNINENEKTFNSARPHFLRGREIDCYGYPSFNFSVEVQSPKYHKDPDRDNDTMKLKV